MTFPEALTTRRPPTFPHWYSSSSSTQDNRATVTLQADLVVVTVEVPGFDPDTCEVKIQRSDGEQHLVIASDSQDGARYESSSVKLRLPGYVGAPISPASFRHGVMTLTFERALPEDDQTLTVEIQHDR